MKPIGATDTWENIMAEQIKNSYKDKDTKKFVFEDLKYLYLVKTGQNWKH